VYHSSGGPEPPAFAEPLVMAICKQLENGCKLMKHVRTDECADFVWHTHVLATRQSLFFLEFRTSVSFVSTRIPWADTIEPSVSCKALVYRHFKLGMFLDMSYCRVYLSFRQ